jgi:hypothetical protein
MSLLKLRDIRDKGFQYFTRVYFKKNPGKTETLPYFV